MRNGKAKAPKGARPAKAAGSVKADGGIAPGGRWWTNLPLTELCPFSKFPIAWLPYPPFKLRVDPKKPNPFTLVDGKHLAMKMIVTGRFAAGRDLEVADIKAMDEYVQRCKLGPFRPSRALELTRCASQGQEEAAKELERFRIAARADFGRLKRIQANRLQQMRMQLASSPEPEVAAVGPDV